MQNPIQKFRQSSIVFEKPGIILSELQLSQTLIIFVEILHTKGCVGFFLICQNKKIPGFYTLKETKFINNSRSKQNKKMPHNLL